MEDKKPKTKIGKFLAKINFKRAAEVAGNIVTGNWKGALDIIADKDNGMTDAERSFALEVMKLDMTEMESVTDRWKSDMTSDSWLSKNVRPLSLIFLTLATTVLIYLDFYDPNLNVPNEWIELLKSLLLGIYIAYCGSRGLEKYKTIGK
jgi:hypothetical protein